MKPLAQVLYEIYIGNSGGLNYQGLPCPKWEALPEAIRGHWKAVADFVERMVKGASK